MSTEPGSSTPLPTPGDIRAKTHGMPSSGAHGDARVDDALQQLRADTERFVDATDGQGGQDDAAEVLASGSKLYETLQRRLDEAVE